MAGDATVAYFRRVPNERATFRDLAKPLALETHAARGARGMPNYKLQGPVSQMSRKRFGSEKPFLNLRPAYSVKVVFSYVAKEIKIKITTKFRASRRPCFEDTKRVMSPETFEKRAPRHQQTFPEVSTIRTPRLNVKDAGIESSVSFSDYQPKLF